MPLDPSIPLRATTVIDPSQGLNALAGAFQYRDQRERQAKMDTQNAEDRAQQNELRALQIASEKYKALDERDQRRLRSTILGAAQLDGYLQAGDVEGAKGFLQNRRQTIEQAKTIDPTLDTRETDQAIQMLESGNIDQLKGVTQNSIRLGQALKFLEQPSGQSGFTLGPGQVRYGPDGKAIAQAPAESKPTELARLIEERAKLPEGSPARATYDAAISKATTHQPGTSVTVNPNSLQPAKTTQGKIDENLMEAGGRMMRLDSIASSFKPEYQTFGTRIGAGWAALKEKGGVGLSASDQRTLSEFSQFKSTALSNLNLYIKEITGAAMSEREADRIRAAMPDPGSGVFDGDSPTQFKAKLDDTIRQVKMAEARNVYLKRNGLSLMGQDGSPVVPLERMPSVINSRGKEIEESLRKANPQADKKSLQKAVMRQLGQEFGIAAD